MLRQTSFVEAAENQEKIHRETHKNINYQISIELAPIEQTIN